MAPVAGTRGGRLYAFLMRIGCSGAARNGETGLKARRMGSGLRIMAAMAVAGSWASGGAGFAQEFWQDTHLLDVHAGSQRSAVARDLSRGGYELSGGEYVDFRDWYSPRIPDVTVLFLTQVAPDFGIIWGFGTGERGEKYSIDPALYLGFAAQYRPFDTAVFSISATYPLFGTMRERTCVADYGAIGGIQTVNCRLAAEPMPPEETLGYLVNLDGETDARISIGFTLVF